MLSSFLNLDELRIDPFDRTKEVHLADVDAVVAENRVGHRDMEIDVWDRHLQQVVLAPSTLPGAQERLTFLPAAPAYCASFTLSANATVFNERLAACGETWQLDAATRKQLGLPPPKTV